uniref:Uncharacterized protein n=1 Tax=Rhizophora mucronata TaxID=61149 RepID=A0A2P2MXE6_RHIMU
MDKCQIFVVRQNGWLKLELPIFPTGIKLLKPVFAHGNLSSIVNILHGGSVECIRIAHFTCLHFMTHPLCIRMLWHWPFKRTMTEPVVENNARFWIYNCYFVKRKISFTILPKQAMMAFLETTRNLTNWTPNTARSLT